MARKNPNPYRDKREVPVTKIDPGTARSRGGVLTPVMPKEGNGAYMRDNFASYGARWSQGWFGPGVPFPPIAPPEVAGRAFDYPYGINLQLTPRAYEALGFSELRALADNYDLLRLVIETRKDQIESIKWTISSKENKEQDRKDEFKRKQDDQKRIIEQKKSDQIKAKATAAVAQHAQDSAQAQMMGQKPPPAPPEPPDDDPAAGLPPVEMEPADPNEDDIELVTKFFQKPDKEHLWASWLRMFLEEVFVIDALTLYPRYDNSDKLYALEIMSGDTIKRLLDETGRTPIPPDPAYQQVLKGLPAIDYTIEELIYMPRNPRANRIYGLSPVEQVVMTVNIALRRQLSQLSFFTEGNIPEALAGVPENWNMDQIKQFQMWFDSMQVGDQSRLRKLKFLPIDPSKIKFTREAEITLKDVFDEWLARIICFAFSIPPTSLVKETNRATAQSVQDQAKTEGLMPILNWIKSILDYIINEVMGYPDIEWKWDMEEGVDPLTRAQIDQIYIGCAVLDPDEVRAERFSKDPMTPEQRKGLFGGAGQPPPGGAPGMPPGGPPKPFGGMAPGGPPKPNPFAAGGPSGGAPPAGGPKSGQTPDDAKDAKKIEEVVRDVLEKYLGSALQKYQQPQEPTIFRSDPVYHISPPSVNVYMPEKQFNVEPAVINITNEQPAVNITHESPVINLGDTNVAAAPAPNLTLNMADNPVTVNMPAINVEKTEVNVSTPDVRVEKIEVQPAQVNVAPSPITINAEFNEDRGPLVKDVQLTKRADGTFRAQVIETPSTQYKHDGRRMSKVLSTEEVRSED
jgi:hypothetical protein